MPHLTFGNGLTVQCLTVNILKKLLVDILNAAIFLIYRGNFAKLKTHKALPLHILCYRKPDVPEQLFLGKRKKKEC